MCLNIPYWSHYVYLKQYQVRPQCIIDTLAQHCNDIEVFTGNWRLTEQHTSGAPNKSTLLDLWLIYCFYKQPHSCLLCSIVRLKRICKYLLSGKNKSVVGLCSSVYQNETCALYYIPKLSSPAVCWCSSSVLAGFMNKPATQTNHQSQSQQWLLGAGSAMLVHMLIGVSNLWVWARADRLGIFCVCARADRLSVRGFARLHVVMLTS